MEEQELISLLPDCLLGSIVQLLPPKAAARTMVLSRRWRRIWPSMPLDLNLHSSDSDVRLLSPASISSILSSHRGPIRRFCVTTLPGAGAATHQWLQTLAERPIDDTLTLKWLSGPKVPTLPRRLLAGAGAALRRLELHGCRLDPSSPAPPLPRLDFLRLSDARISEAALHRMIESCPVLRELHLFMIHGLSRIVFRSRTLTTMFIGSPLVPIHEFSVRHMPNIESLTFSYVDLWRIPAFTIDCAKKLQEIALRLPAIGSSGLSIGSNKKSLPFITSLVLGMKFIDAQELSTAISVLSLFPCLQYLEIWCLEFYQTDQGGLKEWQPAAGTIISQIQQLKHVKFRGYFGTDGEVGFARYLMAIAGSSTKMEIDHSVELSPEDMNRQKDLICIRGKSSHLAQVCFTKSKDSDGLRRNVARLLQRVHMI